MRPDILSPLFADIETLPGIGPKTRKLYAKLLGDNIIDVVFHRPNRIINRKYSPPISQMQDGDIVTVQLLVKSYNSPPRNRKNVPFKVSCMDESGSLDIVFFHAYPDYIRKNLPIEKSSIISGRVERFGQQIQIPHPDYIIPPGGKASIPELETVYPLTQGVSLKMLRNIITPSLKKIPELVEWIPSNIIAENSWPSWREALIAMHQPITENSLDIQGKIISRLAFDELFSQALTLQIMRKSNEEIPGQKIIGNGNLRNKLLNHLPFNLTKGQEKALSEIYSDQSSKSKMMRLLQGDVGSGKTVVALMAMLNAIESGKQAAIMAPTEILALQHYQWIKSLSEAIGIKSCLLIGNMKQKEKKHALDEISNGKVDIIIGTHALFQERVIYKELGLIVIDEQHRFGVEQRAALAKKGDNPDILLMTATPIPRTLVMTLYGDIECSILEDKPAGRKPIDTRIISMAKAEEISSSLSKVIDKKEKIYWVCPLIEDSENETIDLAAAKGRYQQLQQIYGNKVGLVHGKMKKEEREKIMNAFKSDEIEILVATTVIEVGVDVKQATTIIIEQAERFGLSQLHQLRGRVGRNDLDAYCILLYGNINATSQKRLEIMRESNDGFRLAEEDLRIRGSGEITGTKQSGLPEFHFADLREHYNLVKLAHKHAKLLVNKDSKLESLEGKAAKILLYLFKHDRIC